MDFGVIRSKELTRISPSGLRRTAAAIDWQPGTACCNLGHTQVADIVG